MFSGRLLLVFALALSAGQMACAQSTASEQDAPIISHIPRQRVISQGISAVGYSKRLQILEIEFANGAIYRYLEVPASVHRELMSHESKAHYYDENIRGKYRSVHVQARRQ